MSKVFSTQIIFLNKLIQELTKIHATKDWHSLKGTFDLNWKNYHLTDDSLRRFYYALFFWGVKKKKAGVKNMLIACLASEITENDLPYYDSAGIFYIPRKYLIEFGLNELHKNLILTLSSTNELDDKNIHMAISISEGVGLGLTERLPNTHLNKEYTDIDRFITSYKDNDNLDKFAIANINLSKTIVQNYHQISLQKVSKANLNILTFGSCFATHLARNLRTKGVNVNTLRIEELVNSPLAVLDFLHWLYDSDLCCNQNFFNEYLVDSKDQYRLMITDATHIVLTVGVAYFFERNSKIYLSNRGNYVDLLEQGIICQRILSIQECQDSLKKILELLRLKNKVIEIYLSLSPVPLSGIYKNGSILASDVLSKATIRLAINDVVNNSKVYYWPSFEIVKWLAPHVPSRYGFDTFGEDDGITRHPSDWVVNLMVEKFLENIAND